MIHWRDCRASKKNGMSEPIIVVDRLTRQVSDANFKAMVDHFGERGVVETVGLMGHFHTLTMLFVVDRFPVPKGAPDEIKAPR